MTRTSLLSKWVGFEGQDIEGENTRGSSKGTQVGAMMRPKGWGLDCPGGM